MTKEEFDKMDEGFKKFFAKPGEKIKPLNECVDEFKFEFDKMISDFDFSKFATDCFILDFENTCFQNDIIFCEKCGGKIDYDDDYNGLHCTKCEAKYKTTDLIGRN